MSLDTQIVLGPNASLSLGQAWAFMGLTVTMGLGIAAGFAVLGFWPVLPFAGLELAALGAALWASMRRNGYREVLCFDEREVRVEFGRLGQGPERQVRFPRGWTRATLEPGPTRLAPTRLVLSSAGRRVVVGRCLTDEERERLSARLRELLNPGMAVRPGVAGAGPAHELPLGD
ncbi:MAG TPA: DUF2244 domain-containing protein [Solimonas sp.]